MEKILPYFYQIVLIQYSLLFFLIVITQRIKFFRLLYISVRETVLLTVVMITVFVGIRYQENQASLTTAENTLDFLWRLLVVLSPYYIMFVLLFYGMSICFNMTRQALTFWPIMNWLEKMKLVLVPILLLALDLYLCAAMLATY
jgi:hypothetical protein